MGIQRRRGILPLTATARTGRRRAQPTISTPSVSLRKPSGAQWTSQDTPGWTIPGQDVVEHTLKQRCKNPQLERVFCITGTVLPGSVKLGLPHCPTETVLPGRQVTRDPPQDSHQDQECPLPEPYLDLMPAYPCSRSVALEVSKRPAQESHKSILWVAGGLSIDFMSHNSHTCCQCSSLTIYYSLE